MYVAKKLTKQYQIIEIIEQLPKITDKSGKMGVEKSQIIELPKIVDRCGKMSVEQCQIIELPKINDHRGNLTFIENNKHIPFELKRVYYLYDVPGGAERAGHAHKALHQVLVAMSGSFDVVIDNGYERTKYHLNRAYYGLYISPMVWREIENFSSGSVCMALASDFYDESDYYRNYEDFIKAIGE
ncbi:sugar 3,4-ketoisomerase [Brasilonema octagenarum]|nr:FdtA/QdtA family cupin domain-containing protein [Brasilonema octagenarum]